MFLQNFNGGSSPETQKTAECKKKGKKKLLGRVPMQTPDVETRPVTSAIRDIPDQGCKSFLEKTGRSVGYTYVVGQGFGKLGSASNLAPKLPEAVPHTSGPQNLRSLLSMEYRLSDLPLERVHTWLWQRTGAPVNRESA